MEIVHQKININFYVAQIRTFQSEIRILQHWHSNEISNKNHLFIFINTLHNSRPKRKKKIKTKFPFIT